MLDESVAKMKEMLEEMKKESVDKHNAQGIV